ncbi:adpribosylation crystallin [Stylonychia lemnae]|uniref:Adpribosylation crystallin n=1 Tax=Stylonychia lemnae TaxID=5949 RepID=A0A077ZZJ7_STYLE|nr:adpribosylation crystallin [Stylonychia lemnae]|eukprot:CDW75320.1 adpribosylation crystallin [Stylonychia lemnae]
MKSQHQEKKKDKYYEIKELNFYQIGKSQVTLWHRPGKKEIYDLKNLQNISLIVTLQGTGENPNEIKKGCQQNGIQHKWINIQGANQALLDDKKVIAYLVERIQELYENLSTQQERVLIHCAAGVHRTGITAYTLLRLDGLCPQDAYETLKLIRLNTYQGVGEWRIQLAEAKIVPPLMKIILENQSKEILQQSNE